MFPLFFPNVFLCPSTSFRNVEILFQYSSDRCWDNFHFKCQFINLMYLLTPTNICNCFLLQINITVSFIKSYVYLYVFLNDPVLVIYVDIFNLILGFLIFLFDHLCTLLTFFCWAIYLLVSFDSLYL